MPNGTTLATSERAFLRETHAGACKYFRTVLGPGSDRHHENHLHLDLAMHGKTSRGLRHYCRPKIRNIAPPPRQDNLPDPPYLEPDPEIARNMNRNRRSPSRMALRPPVSGVPIGNIPRTRPRSLPPADIPAVASRTYGGPTYGRLQQLQPGAPIQLDNILLPRASASGRLRADGVYVPPGH